MRHIAFVVDDLDTIVRGLRDEGMDTLGEIQEYEAHSGSATSAVPKDSSSNSPSTSAPR
jgi:hypothetical protein